MPENVAAPAAPPSSVPNNAPAVTPNPGAAKATQTPGTGQDKSVPAPPKPEDYFEVKVNGQTRRYTREQALARLTMAEGAHEKFDAAAQKEKKFNDWKAKAQTDTLQALMDPELGLSKEQIKDRFETWYKKNFIEPHTLTPEQRELNELREEREARKKRDEETEQNQKKTLEQQESQQQYQTVQQEIIETLEKSNLPKTRFYAHRIAFYKAQNIAKGYDAPPEVIIDQVRNEGRSILSSLAQEATVEQLLEECPDLVKKIRRFDMENLKKRYEPKQTAIPAAPGNRAQRQGSKSMRDVDQYFNNLRRSR